jgi:hypothetical protein
MCIMEINITNFMIAKLTRVPRNKFRNCDMCSSKNYEFYWIDQPTWGLGLEPTKCRHVKPKSGTLREIAMFNDEDENMSRNFLRLSLNWKKLRKKGEKKTQVETGPKKLLGWSLSFFRGVQVWELSTVRNGCETLWNHILQLVIFSIKFICSYSCICKLSGGVICSMPVPYLVFPAWNIILHQSHPS